MNGKTTGNNCARQRDSKCVSDWKCDPTGTQVVEDGYCIENIFFCDHFILLIINIVPFYTLPWAWTGHIMKKNTTKKEDIMW